MNIIYNFIYMLLLILFYGMFIQIQLTFYNVLHMADPLQLEQFSYRSNKIDEDSKQLALIQHQNLEKALYRQRQQIRSSKTEFYISLLQKLGNLCLPCSLCCCRSCFSYPLYQQQTGGLGLLSKFGKYQSTVKPGLKIINPITQRIISVSLKTNTLSIQQQIITKDNVQLKVESIIFYRVFAPTELVYKLGSSVDYTRSCVSQIAKASLRSVTGCIDFQTLLQNREDVGFSLSIQINRQVNIWGIYIETCSIKQIILNKQMVDTFAIVATTKRKSQALLISAQANVQCAKLIKQAADILDNKAAMQIRYLEAVQTILLNQKDNIIFLSLNQNKK